MKYILTTVVAVLMLCGFAFQALAVPSATADDVTFLKGCGIAQADIDVIPNLNRPGQLKIRAVLLADDRQCGDVQPFQASRAFVRLFTPPPSAIPFPPKGYDNDYLTQAESDFISKWEKDMLVKQGVLPQ
jgi:hypothetical protein